MPGAAEEQESVYYDVVFGQVHVNNSPRIQEADDSYLPVFPHEARIRNLTYATEIYVDVKLVKLIPEYTEKSGLKEGQKREMKFRVESERTAK